MCVWSSKLGINAPFLGRCCYYSRSHNRSVGDFTLPSSHARGVTENSQAFHIPVLFHRACPCAVLWRDDIFDHLVQECRYVRVLACGFALCLLPPVLTSTLLSRVEGNGSRPLSVAQLQV